MVQTLSVSQDLQYLVELFPRDSTGALRPQFLSTRDIAISPTDPTAPNREYDGRVILAMNLKREMHEDGRLAGPSIPAYGAVEIALDTDWKSANLATWRGYGWDGAQVRILKGPRGSTSYAAYTVLLDGQCSGANEYGLSTIKIPIGDLQEQIGKDISAATYDGSGGFNGGADAKGKLKPIALGWCPAVEPFPVDLANLWYDVDPVNGLTSIQLVEDGGVALTESASNPPPSGQYYKDLANGRVRVGSTPVKQLRVSCRGAFGGGAQTAGAICKALLTSSLGFSSGQIDSASFTALDVKNSAPVGFYASGQTSGQAVLDYLLGAVGAFYTGSQAGKLTVGRLEAPISTDPSDASVKIVIEDADLEKSGTTIRPEAIPPYRIILKYGRNWGGGLQESDLAGGATAARRSYLGQEYRSTTPKDAAAVQTLHPLSKPLEIETAFRDEADAIVERDRLAALYSAQRDTVTVKIETQPFALELGDEAWVSSTLYGIDRAFIVTGTDENTRDTGRVTITMWG